MPLTWSCRCLLDLLTTCYFWRVIKHSVNRCPPTEKCFRVRCGHYKLMLALGKWNFFTVWGLQISLGVRYKEVKSQQGLYKAQLEKQWCYLLVMAGHSLSTQQQIWRTWSGQVTRMHSPYTTTGWSNPECWNNEILIKCRKFADLCSRAGWEQSDTCAAFAVELLKGAVWCTQSAELSQANGSDWVLTSCSTGASGFCLTFHAPKLAVLPIPTPVSHAAFVHHF